MIAPPASTNVFCTTKVVCKVMCFMMRKRDAYEGQLEFLCRVSMLDNKLAKRLANPMASTFLRNLIEMII